MEDRIKKSEEFLKLVKGDFRNFLALVWRHLNLPKPTELQLDIANELQNADNKYFIIEAFRGVGKSWITSSYVAWLLLNNPMLNILVFSATKTRADDFSGFVQRLIKEMPFLKHLEPDVRKGQRNSKIAFDVGPSNNSHAPSVKSIGISSQTAGNRADIIIADDVEGSNNSNTEGKREKLLKQVEDFQNILKPDLTSKVIYLGTPQSESSIYNKLGEKKNLEGELVYKTLIWPAEKPIDASKYAGKLAPYIVKMDIKPGEPTEPIRFGKKILAEKLATTSRSNYQLQFMLDTSMSDYNRYPLKISDLMVFNTPKDKAPINISYSSIKECILNDFPNLGMDGDRFYKPFYVDEEYKKFESIAMAIDPAGRGKDETAYCVIGLCIGKLYILDIGGLKMPGASDEALDFLCLKALEYNVNDVVIESNFGAYVELFKTHSYRFGVKARIEPIFHTKQKETRIIQTLSPVMIKHNLIISEDVVRKEIELLNFSDKIVKIDDEDIDDNDDFSVKEFDEKLSYSFFFQLSRINNEKGCLVHDDKLDALSMVVEFFQKDLDRNIDIAINSYRNNLKKQVIDAHIKRQMNNNNDNNKNVIKINRNGFF